MRITALEPQRRDPERINIYVDGEFRCGVAAEVARRAGLSVGNEVDADALERLEHDEVLWRARDAAYGLLSYRPRTRRELRRRLLRKGYASDVIESVLTDLAEKGYVDDSAFAESFVRDRLRLRPRGRRRLVQELRKKGVEPAVAERVVEHVLLEEGISESELAHDLARGWMRRRGSATPTREERRAQRRRLYAFLARRGFAGEVAREAIESVIPD